MYIEMDNLSICDLELQDAKAYIEMAQDGSLNDIFGDCKDCSKWMINWIKEARKFYVADNPNEDYLAYAIVDKKNNIPVGSVGCSYYDDLKKIGITYFVGEKYRKKGIATKAVICYVNYFFNHYNISEIIATVRCANTASCKTLEKAGFILKESKMYQDINDEKEELYNFYEIQK